MDLEFERVKLTAGVYKLKTDHAIAIYVIASRALHFRASSLTWISHYQKLLILYAPIHAGLEYDCD